jgi:hypothetical protein
MKTFGTITALLLSLCAPALAGDAGNPIGVKVAVSVGSDHRVYELSLVENRCAQTHVKSADRDDTIDVCAESAQAGKTDVRLDMSWSTSQRTTERRGKTSIVLARGATTTVSAVDGFRVEVTAQ